MTLRERCPIIEFKTISDARGSLAVIEGEQSIPFCINRVFYLYGLDNTVVRGQHANLESEFVLINVSGKSKVRLTDSKEEIIINLDRPMVGLFIPKMVWKEMFDFSSDSVLLILASTHYSDSEYIRNYDEYKKMMGQFVAK